MLTSLPDDLEFFRETTSRFLADKAPVAELRRLRDSAAGFESEFWRQGAELGWTSLLVAEHHGGGSISGDRLLDLSVVAHEFGRHAAPGPLVPTNITAWTLSEHETHLDLLADVMAGTAIVAWGDAERAPNDHLGEIKLEISVDGDEIIVTGEKRPVESANDASHILVTGRSGERLSQVLVPTNAPGVSLSPMNGVDLTRRFSTVQFDSVRVAHTALVGDLGGAADAIEHQRLLALLMANAEAVGAMQTGFNMTLEWAVDRYSFGRPLASYQAIKHRFADMSSWLEASHALCDSSTAALSARSADAAELGSAAKAFIGEFGSELLQECVQFHGGIGVTFEHDLHMSLRRHTTNRALFGTPAEHRRRVAQAAIDREVAS